MVREGYMVKRGAIRKNWKRRCFKLNSNGILQYFNSKQQLLNEIDLSLSKNIGIATAQSHTRQWMYVQSQTYIKRTFFLCTIWQRS